MELHSRKKSIRDRMMRSKSFETQEVREIGRKKSRLSTGFLILWIVMIKDVFQMEGKECKDQKTLKMCRRKSMPERRRCFSMGYAIFLGPVAVDEKKFVAAAKNSAGEKGEQKK